MTRLARGGKWSGLTAPVEREEGTAARGRAGFKRLVSAIKPRPERPRKARRFMASGDGGGCIEFNNPRNRSRRRQSAHFLVAGRLAPTDVGGYAFLKPHSRQDSFNHFAGDVR